MRFRAFWLVRDYLPEFAQALTQARPGLRARAASIDATIEPVPIPGDCRDGFFHAYWRRPDAYLQAHVRRATSVWARLGPDAEERAVQSLSEDLATGRWHARNAELLPFEEAELGARLLTADTRPRPSRRKVPHDPPTPPSPGRERT